MLVDGPGTGTSRSPPCAGGRSTQASCGVSSSSDCPRSPVKTDQVVVSGLLNEKVPSKLQAVRLRCQ